MVAQIAGCQQRFGDTPPAHDAQFNRQIKDCGAGPGSGEAKGLSVKQTGSGDVTVTTPDGRYTADLSTATGGEMNVTDNKTGKSFLVYGDPHILTSQGGTADFQHSNVTFNLPDGTKMTVEPTDNPGVNTIKSVTISSGNNKGVDAVKVTGFQNGSLSVKTLSGEAGHRAGDEAERGSIELKAKDGNIADLVGRGGLSIHKTADGNIDGYAPKAGQGGPGQQHMPGPHHFPGHHGMDHHGKGHHAPHHGPGHRGGESELRRIEDEVKNLKQEIHDFMRSIHEGGETNFGENPIA